MVITGRNSGAPLLVLLVLLTVVNVCGSEVCSLTDQEWADLRNSQKRSFLGEFQVSSADEDCFCVYARRLLESADRRAPQTFKLDLEKRAAHDFSMNLLFCLCRIDALRADSALLSFTVSAWDANSSSTHDLLSGLIAKRRFFQADTLYSILDQAGMIDVNEYLRWAMVKGVMNRFSEASELYCRVIIALPRLSYIALSQMAKYMEDADKDTVSNVLDQVVASVLLHPQVDTVVIRDWMADYCARKGLFRKEQQILLLLETSDSPVGHRLWKSAKDHFSSRRYRLAADAGVKAYERLSQEQMPTQAAAILYQSYLQLLHNDSALVWLKRADLNVEEHQVQAAALYQHTGHMQKALSLIETLKPSIARDTLMIRHHLYSQDPQKASQVVKKSDSELQRHSRDALLWYARAALFSLNLQDASMALDSISYSSFWHGMQEVLSLRYWLRRLRDWEVAVQLWAQLQYKLYVGDPGAAAALVKKSTVDSELLQLFSVIIAKEYIANGQVLKALELLGGFSEQEMSAEYMYYKALALKGTANIDDAKILLQKIVLEHPMSVYAQKARILLLNITL